MFEDIGFHAAYQCSTDKHTEVTSQSFKVCIGIWQPMCSILRTLFSEGSFGFDLLKWKKN